MYVRSTARPIESDSPTLDWAVALAGSGDVRAADGLCHTLDRLNRLTPASRTLTVFAAGSELDLGERLEGRSDHTFHQPSLRDSGVAIYVALAMIKRWTPNALVTIAPATHQVASAQPYVEQVRIARGMAARMRNKVIVLGGKMILGDALVEVPNVRTVVDFVSTPPKALVVCGTATALWDLGHAAQPELVDLLDFLVPLIGMPDEFDAIDYVYRTVPPISFARDILERFPDRLMAMPLDGVEWGSSEPAVVVVDHASAG